MITKQQAMSLSEFFIYNASSKKVERWRRNGQTQTWKTRPREFRVPVKFGLYAYGQIRESEAHRFFVDYETCKLAGVVIDLVGFNSWETSELIRIEESEAI